MHNEQFDYFALAYRLQSFAAAAKRIPMSAQGLTKAIRSLEAELGVALFVTDQNGNYQPTPYADELIGFVENFNSNYRYLQGGFQRIRAQENNEIRLGTSLGILGALGPDFLDSFHAANPGITVVYNELPDDLCEAKLLDDAYDMALTLVPFSEQFNTTPLGSYEICFWVHESDPLFNKQSLVFSDFADRVVAIPGKDFKVYRILIDAAVMQGFAPAKTVPSSELFWIYEFVCKGKGIGFTTSLCANLALFNSHIDVVALPFKGVVWSFGISYLPSHHLTSKEQLFYDHCVAYATKSSGT